MWMCDRCQSINDDGKASCPQCGAPPVAVGVRPPAAAQATVAPGVVVPQFGRSASAAGEAPAPPVSTDQPPGQPGAPYAPPGQIGAPYAPPAGSSPSTAEKVAVGVGIGVLVLVFLGRLLNPIRLGFVAIGIGVIFLGHYMEHRDDAFRKTAMRASGRVVRLDQTGIGDDLHYYPVVDFTTRDGVSAEFRDSMGSRPASNHVGDTVAVFYNPLAPSDAQIDSSTSHWIGIGMYVFGVVFVFGGIAGSLRTTDA